MWEIFENYRGKNKKKDWKPPYEELFSTLSLDWVNKSIAPYLELLKTSDYKWVLARFKKKQSMLSLFKRRKANVQEAMESSFKEFVDYLLDWEKYKEFFKESMGRYVVKSDDNWVFQRVYDDSLNELEYWLHRIKGWKSEQLSPFLISQVIKLLRWEAFVFKSWEWMIWFEKDYLYWDDARYINWTHWLDSGKPVYWFRMHVWEWADIFRWLKPVLNDFRTFYESTDLWAVPFVWMRSWLLDTDFLKYRLSLKGWKPEIVDRFISKNEEVLWKVELSDIATEANYKKVSKRIKNHLKWDEVELVDNYEKAWNKLKEGSCLVQLYQ